MKRRMLGMVLTALALYGALCLLVFLVQGRLIYFPARGLAGDPSALGMGFETVEVTAPDGVRLHGWWIPADAAVGALLFSHGNAGNISGRLPAARAFREMGLSVLLYDYRGYGESQGRPNEAGLYRDALAFYDYLVHEREVAPAKLVLYGESLGVAAALEVAARRPVAGLIAESGFTSLTDVGARHYPWLPVRLLLRQRFENERKIAGVSLPVLLVHSPDDEIVPFDHAERLRAAATGPVRLLATGGGHNEGGFLQLASWREEVHGWLRGILGPATPSPDD